MAAVSCHVASLMLLLGVATAKRFSSFESHDHFKAMSVSGTTDKRNHVVGWEDAGPGLCGCSDSVVLDGSYVQFKDVHECAANCYWECWNWRAPNGASYTQVRPQCLVIIDSTGSEVVDASKMGIKGDEQWMWRDTVLPDARTLYFWGAQVKDKRTASQLKTWKWNAGVLTQFSPEKVTANLPGTCICSNDYWIPFLDVPKKYRSVEMCHDKCQAFCQSLAEGKNRLATLSLEHGYGPGSVADQISFAWCVGEDFRLTEPIMKTECRCYSKALVATSETGKAVVREYTGKMYDATGQDKQYSSLARCEPKRCKTTGDSANQYYQLPTINPYSCFRNSCADHCMQVLGHLSKEPKAAECVDADGNQHFTVMAWDRAPKFQSIRQEFYPSHENVSGSDITAPLAERVYDLLSQKAKAGGDRLLKLEFMTALQEKPYADALRKVSESLQVSLNTLPEQMWSKAKKNTKGRHLTKQSWVDAVVNEVSVNGKLMLGEFCRFLE